MLQQGSIKHDQVFHRQSSDRAEVKTMFVKTVVSNSHDFSIF